jgi:VanZ family protein
MKRFLRYWLPPLVLMGVIFVSSAMPDLPSPGPPGEWLDTVVKKTGHVVSYGVLAWLYQRALNQYSPTMSASGVLSIGLAMLYGATDEFHQTFVPGRRGRVTDVGLDGIGACAAMLLVGWLGRRRERARRATVAR